MPIAILLFVFWSQYDIIHTLLDEENISLWKTFGFVLLLLGFVNFIYTLYLVINKKNVSYIYGLLALLAYIPFLYLYGYNVDDIIPFSIPRWMISDDLLIYTGTFLMPTLAYALFVLVTYFTPDDKNNEAWKNFLAAIAIPASWYVFIQIILPFWQPVSNNFGTHTLLILIIIGTLMFLFFLIRGIYILTIKRANIWKEYQLFWEIPISLILPLIGLAVNNGHLFNGFGVSNSGVFGNFNNNWFYVLAVINGILICLPNLVHKIYRLFLFIGRCITFTFTFYFFLVFLPFLPLSIVAIVLIGLGFLMLAPLLLFIIHINKLAKDFKYLKKYFSTKLINITSILSFLVIPLFITSIYLNDKSVLNNTLDYLYNPSYSKEYTIDKNSLAKTLNVVKQHKERNRGGFVKNQIPYLSSYFNWLALDNLTLSEAKINYIERVFWGESNVEVTSEFLRNKDVEISDIGSSSWFDTSQNTWISWINIEITNSSENWSNEYATTIDLPTGSWISDYYLYVGDRKEMGILAEKKTAMWVFSQIRNENKDPGILYYLTGNKVAFRVFPFAKDEVRKTGIEIIHKEPITINVDNNIVELGDSIKRPITPENNENLAYVSSKEKAKLPLIKRTPYYHFLVDVSKDKKHLQNNFVNRIEQLMQKNIISNENTQISFVNSVTSTIAMDEAWKDSYSNQGFDGGFYLDRAIKTTLFDSHISKCKTYPVMVVVTDTVENAIIDNNFSDFEITFPDNEFYYHLDKNGDLIPYSLLTNKRTLATDSLSLSFGNKILAYPNKEKPIAFLRNNNEASIVLKNLLFDIEDVQVTTKNWASGLNMQGEWLSQILYPETSNKKWLKSVKHSFMSKIMTPYTSYIVVENEAQRAILKKKQEQVLSGNKSLDLNEDTQRMSEPNLVLLSILLISLLWIKEKRRQRLVD